MERLTKKDCYGHWHTNEKVNDRMQADEPYPHAYDGKPIDKLADYEDFAEIFEKHFSKEALELLSDKKEFSKWLERGKRTAIQCDKSYRELQAYKDKEEQGLLIELPVAIGSTVYVISMCGNVNLIMDGDFETATGYYCPFELKSQCPHDCDDCEDVKNNLAVFEDTISYIGIDETGIHLFTEDAGMCCTLGKDTFLTRSEAEEALAKMGGTHDTV